MTLGLAAARLYVLWLRRQEWADHRAVFSTEIHESNRATDPGHKLDDLGWLYAAAAQAVETVEQFGGLSERALLVKGPTRKRANFGASFDAFRLRQECAGQGIGDTLNSRLVVW
ncbi:hypothetical protein GCM10017056_39880 [Seohaeicola zhoushanensis]|uniref:Uncharacterized protein n=1 Tax=Seohaeicola zhoushanensis TaxID=1569283 RepID=A0A8J3H1D8_9RHOB|nr:hypothetical protein GCM10017056_39880 [Seohaeicola zhoushanensis]